jgi:murein DD-endopeptidase MepM/ murein hydrolase activator NlpD
MTAFKAPFPKLAAVSLALALTAACATPQPQYPVRVDPAAPPPAPPPPPPPPPAPAPPPRDPDAPIPAPSTPVQAAPLPPVGAPRPAAPTPAPATQPAPVPGASVAPASYSQQPTSPWVQPPIASQTPREATVGPGETLFDVAERVRTPIRALIEINNLQPPYDLRPGTVLRVPPPVIYTVRPGDTLFGIARRFNIDPRSLANLNGFAMETSLRPGQAIGLPSLARDQGSNAQASGTSPLGMALATARPAAPARPAAAGVVPAPAPTTAPAVIADAQIAGIGRGKFAWPVRGRILSTFGPKGPGQRNDGLNIAGSAGQRVSAAATGEVVYAGELPGFGNLVLLKHEGGWVTAYAHLSRIGVKMRDRVTQGQAVGDIGQTGLVDQPQLHFEIRYAPNPREKARPVDPSMLLPS